MKYSYIVRTCVVLNFVLLCSGAGPARAEDPRFLSAYHSEYGLKLFNDENYDLAAERFAKAFLLDPQNQIAKETLQKIAAEKTLQGSSGLKILRFIDQVEYIDFLTVRYQGLTEENTRLLEFLRNNKNLSSDEVLLEKFHTVEKQISGKPSALPHVGLIGFAGEESQTVNLDNLINQLAQERANLAKEVGFWEEQNNQLRDFRKTVLFQSSTVNPLAEAGKVKSQLEEINQRVVQKDQLLTVQQENIEYFKNELTSVRSDFNALQEKFKATDIKIVELTTKIASMSVELFEKNKILGEKDERAANLQNDLNMANEKFNLVQRIIKEKDDRIAALETEMGQLQTSFASGLPADNQMSQLQGDLRDFQTEFKDQIEKSRDRLISLEKQYTDLTAKYEALQKDTLVKDAQMALLNSTADQKTRVANQYREAFLQTDEKVNQLVGMIEIYRGKLYDTKQDLSSKENELKQLQGVLFQVNPPSQTESPVSITPQENQSTSGTDYNLTLSKPSSIHQAR